MKHILKYLQLSISAGLFALILSGCGGGSESQFVEQDISEEIDAYYKEHSNFYQIATLADLPAYIEWTSNDHLPEIGSPDAKKGGTQNLRIQDFPRTLRLVGADSNSSFRPFLLDDTFPRFGHIHPNVEGGHQFYAELADSWFVDQENRTVYVRIDPTARWSDDKPITVDDLFFMFFLYQSTYIQQPWYNNYYGIGVNYEKVTRYDDHTFSITMVERRPDLEARVLQVRPMPKHFFLELGDDYNERYNWKFTPTPGPYTLSEEELQRSQRNRNSITFVRNPDWWGNNKKHLRYRYNADRLRIRVIRDTPKAFEAFLAGELDWFGMNLAEYQYELFPDTHELVQRGLVHKASFYNDVPRPTFGLWMNTSKPLLGDLNVRLGIQHATNWQLVIDQYFRGDYIRMQTTADGYGDMSHPDIRAREFDINKAQEYFAKAGFVNRGSDGILVNDRGERLSFNLGTGYESLAPILSILRQEAIRAGLEFRPEVLDASAAWKKVQEKNHDIAFSAFNVGVERYPRYWETYHSVNAYDVPFLEDGLTPNPDRKPKVQTNNLESMAIPELDKMIDTYDRLDDLDEMRELAFRMEELLHDHASFVPGFIMPFYRIAYWRWVKWPDDFNARYSRSADEFFLHWIDEDVKTETMSARRGSESFPVEINVYDHWKTK